MSRGSEGAMTGEGLVEGVVLTSQSVEEGELGRSDSEVVSLYDV